MTYKEALGFLFSRLPAYHRIGKAAYKNDLNNSLTLDVYFGHPHMKYKTIHIAGTNGKGSVSHLIASVLQEAGFRTGLYTSPHLKDFRERIKVNGEMISKRDVVAFVSKHYGIIDSLKPSFFELTVTMALDFFNLQAVDIAVVEVGLGGRLDSTNIINPIISVITNIGHDHMDLLGDTLEKVAFEKSGIIKIDVPVVIGETHPETSGIFISKATETASEIFFADSNFNCALDCHALTDSDRKFTITDLADNKKISGLIPLGGDYQSKNLQTLFQVFKSLKERLNISDSDILHGIEKVIVNTGLMGRWQILGRNPLTICDTGHNKEGLEYIMCQINKIPSTGLHVVVGFVKDKDLTSILPLFPKKAKYYFTRASIPRALDEKILMSEASGYDLSGESYSTVNKALKAALSKALPTDLVFIGGSTFVVAEVI
jgi:dihydrofolate synthase / folylpolyglutamate synthase